MATEKDLNRFEKRYGFIPAGLEPDRSHAKYRFMVAVTDKKGQREILSRNLTRDRAEAEAEKAGKTADESSAVSITRDKAAEENPEKYAAKPEPVKEKAVKSKESE